VGLLDILLDLLKSPGQREEERLRLDAARAEESALAQGLQGTVDTLRRGGVPQPVQPDGKIVLRQGESLYVNLSPVSQHEERWTRTDSGGAGTSVRVVKGVTFHVGGRMSVQTRQLVEVDQGQLYVTNRKVMFVGKKKSVTIPMDRVASSEHFVDGIKISSASSSTQIFVLNKGVPPVYWDMADATIEALISRME
jgi:hypothetical protein